MITTDTIRLSMPVPLPALAVLAMLHAPAVAKSESKPPSTPPAVTFNKDVAPLLFKHCASCHRPGEVGPFSLLGYADAKKRAKQLLAVTETRLMPPWKAESHGQFQNERRLGEAEINTLKKWVASGMEEGKATDLPKPPVFPKGWQIGEPDLVLDPGEDYKVPAEGRDIYRNFVIPTNFDKDRYLRAVEIRAGNARAVHHVLLFLDTSGAARRLDARDPGPGYSTFGGPGFLPSGGVGGWAPGNLPQVLPDGIGHQLPKGADIVMQVHYHPTGKPETDRTRLGLHFTTKPVDKIIRTLPVINFTFNIPPGESHHRVDASFPVLTDVTIHSVTPHMHLLGKEMFVYATLPDGTRKSLVRVPKWDFNWQTTYVYKEPLKLPRGASVRLEAAYDNSESNPNNPSRPPKAVRWGEQTTDEMCIAFLAYTVDAEKMTEGKPASGVPNLFGGGTTGRRAERFLLGKKP